MGEDVRDDRGWPRAPPGARMRSARPPARSPARRSGTVPARPRHRSLPRRSRRATRARTRSGHVTVRPVRRVREPLDRGHRGRRTRVEHHPARRLERLVADLDGARPVEPAVAAHEPGARRPRAGRRRPGRPSRRWPRRGSGRRPAPVGPYVGLTGEAVDPASLRERVARADHHLARDAAEVRALAPDQPLVHPPPRARPWASSAAVASPPGPRPITTTSHAFVAMGAVWHRGLNRLSAGSGAQRSRCRARAKQNSP